MGATKQTIEQEVQARYEASFEVLANRCLGEPYNFHRIAPMLQSGLLTSDLISAKIISACLHAFKKSDNYTPQGIGLMCGLLPAQSVEMGQRDSEMGLIDAMEAFLLYQGQWAEINLSKHIETWIVRGLSSEEIQIEAARMRKDMGLSARLMSSDGKEGFEKRLLAAIDGIIHSFPVTPHLEKERSFIQFYEPGDYIVVQALSGVGKTYEALSEIYHLSVKGVPSCCINLENTPENMQKRVWQMHSNTWFRPDLRGTDAQMQHYLRCWDEVKKMPFRSYNPGPELPAVLGAIRQDWHERGIQFAVIDYAQLMNIPGYRGMRNYELGEISAAFRALALELQIPVMALAQSKQDVDKRGDKRPGLYDIKDCANFGQDATIVKSIYRPAYHDITQDEQGNDYPVGYAEHIIVKGRESGTAVAKCSFDHIKGFYDAATQAQQQPAYTQPIDYTEARPKRDEEVNFGTFATGKPDSKYKAPWE